MIKFYYDKKIRFLLMLINLFKYTFWCVFFLLQGQAIQLSLEKNTLLSELVFTLGGFIVIKGVVMATDIFKQYKVAHIANQEMAKQWQKHFPRRLFRDNADNGNMICLLYFDYLPNAFRLESSMMNHHYTLISIIIVLVTFFLVSKFYLGLLIACILFSLNFISKRFFLDRMSRDYLEITDKKNQTFQWILEYFQAWRELSLCWKSTLKRWSENQYEGLHHANQRLIETQLLRDVTTQCLVEIPFVLNTCAMILAIYFNYISITHFFVWIGCSQFIIQAANAYTEKRSQACQKKALFKKIDEILKLFDSKIEEKPYKRAMKKSQIDAAHTVSIKLTDGSDNRLSLLPGIYLIQGRNGSGKTTLLNVVMGYERLMEIYSHEALQSLLNVLTRRNVRLVDRDPVLFDRLSSFDQQILGAQVNQRERSWTYLFDKNMQQWLMPKEREQLKTYFMRLEANFYGRHTKIFSAGEKVFVSLMRVLLSWDNEVYVLIIDECDAFLDFQSKNLFREVIKQLSKKTAIYLTTHEQFDNQAGLKKSTESFNQ